MKHLMIAGLALALCGCATTGPGGMSEKERIEFGCFTASVASHVLFEANNDEAFDFTPAQRALVNSALETVAAVCAAPPDTYRELQALGFSEALIALQEQVRLYRAAKNAKP